MPFWNREQHLTQSLKAYARLYDGLGLEFSVCDDGSVTPLKRPEMNVKVTRLPFHIGALNPCVPINVAVRQSTHDIIVLTNPEVEHREPVLQQMLLALNEAGPDGYVMAGCIETTTGARIAGPGTPYGRNGRMPIPGGTDVHFCAMFRRELFDAVGGFDESYRHGLGCEDNDWLWALRAADAHFVRVPVDVYHTRTPHRWTGTLERNAKILAGKWGRLREYKCAL